MQLILSHSRAFKDFKLKYIWSLVAMQKLL